MRIRTKLPGVAMAFAVTTLATFATAQTTTRISVDSVGNQANGKSATWAIGAHWISQDDRYLAFHSDGTNLVAAASNFAKRDYFELSDAVQREAPKVSFS